MTMTRTEALELAILERVAGGESFRAICTGADMPTEAGVRYWASADPGGFGEALRAAREASAAHWDGEAERVLVEAAGTREEISRARELSQVYRWRARCYAPRQYADRIDVTVAAVSVAEQLGEARARRALIDVMAEPVPAVLPAPAASEAA